MPAAGVAVVAQIPIYLAAVQSRMLQLAGIPSAVELARHLVIVDFRGPDSIRLGLAAPYTRFVDVHDAMARIRTLVE